MWWVFILIALLSVVIALLFLNVNLCAQTIPGREGFFIFRVKVLGITFYKTILYLRLKHYICPVIVKVKKKKFKVLFRYVFKKQERKKNPFTQSIFKACKIKSLDFQAKISMEDAALTALFCGILNNACKLYLLFLKKKIETARIMIHPDFQHADFFFSYHLNGIITARIANIITIYLKERGGEKKYAPNRNYSKYNNVGA